MALPVLQKIIALLGRGKAVHKFERSPMRFRNRQIVENLHARNAPVRHARMLRVAVGWGRMVTTFMAAKTG